MTKYINKSDFFFEFTIKIGNVISAIAFIQSHAVILI